MNDLVLPSLVMSPPRESPNNHMESLTQAGSLSPKLEMSQSISSLPPNSGSIVQKAFPQSSLSGIRVGCDILTVQQRFDTTRKKLHQLAVAVKRERDPKQRAKMVEESRNLQLFSTLLYITLMMHKIDEIKILLKESDPGTYVSNQMIFDSLRSPNFHLQRHHEGLLKMKKVFERKQKYKVMYDEAVLKLAEYEEKVGKLQDLATGTAKDFGQAVANLTAGDSSGSAASTAAADEKVKNLNEKVAGLEASLDRAMAELNSSKDSLLSAQSQLSDKSVALAEAEKDVELARLLGSSSSAEKEKLLEEQKAEVDSVLEGKTLALTAAETKILQLQAALEAKDKDYATIVWEYQKLSNVQGNVDHEKVAQMEAVQIRLKETEAALAASEDVLNHSQKRVIILESSLEKEVEKREAAEDKCRAMKFELAEVAEKFAELQEKGVDVGDLNRPLSRGGDAAGLDDGSLTNSISSYAVQKFPPETEYSIEMRKKRQAEARMIQNCSRKRMSYMKWFNMKMELTSKAGVMMALSGTPQGMTGFYLNPSTNTVYYWTVKETGEWLQMFEEMPFDNYKKLEAKLRKEISKAGTDNLDTVFVQVPSSKGEEGGNGYYVNHKGKAGFYYKDEGTGQMVLSGEK